VNSGSSLDIIGIFNSAL